jgi:hypothetical protein
MRIPERQNTMWPMCVTTPMMIAGSVASAGGLAAVAVKKSAAKKSSETSEPRRATVGYRGAPGRISCRPSCAISMDSIGTSLLSAFNTGPSIF